MGLVTWPFPSPGWHGGVSPSSPGTGGRGASSWKLLLGSGRRGTSTALLMVREFLLSLGIFFSSSSPSQQSAWSLSLKSAGTHLSLLFRQDFDLQTLPESREASGPAVPVPPAPNLPEPQTLQNRIRNHLTPPLPVPRIPNSIDLKPKFFSERKKSYQANKQASFPNKGRIKLMRGQRRAGVRGEDGTRP